MGHLVPFSRGNLVVTCLKTLLVPKEAVPAPANFPTREWQFFWLYK